MARNSDQFLISYNKIEQHLKTLLETDDYIPFMRSVDLVVKKKLNPVVKRYRDDLLEFAELRNAIVHKSMEPDFAIAEPHDRVVQSIMKIEEEISEPKKVIPMFSRTVQSFQLTDALSDLLLVIRDKEYSQFPVYEDGVFKGLVTRKGITNWLAKNVEKETVSLQGITLEDILLSEEGVGNYQFIHQDMSIYEAEEIFKDCLKRGKRLDALLITENGETNERLLGIVTSWSLMTIP